MDSPGGRRGQVLIGVIIIMLVMAIIVPAMVMFVQNEAKWSVKQNENVSAFHLAEAAIDRGYRKISESTGTWADAQENAIFPSGYQFNRVYTDLTGGCYAISISSGPVDDQVTIISVGIQSKGHETRAIKAIYTNSATDIAIHAKGAVGITGNNFQLEWGAVVTPKAITIGTRSHPQYYSGSSIDKDTNGSAPPNCDSPNCIWWYSYDSSIPPQPDIDFDFYRSSAQGVVLGADETVAASCAASPAGSTYYPATCANPVTFGNVTTQKGRTIFVEGNAHINSSGGNHHIIGNFIVMGNLTTSNGNIGTGTETIPIPQTAWKQYGNDWPFYLATYNIPGGDTTAPAAFPGLTSGYRSPATAVFTITGKIFTHGFLYIGGNFSTGTGGGSFALVGTAYVNGNVSLDTNSQGRLYYDAETGNKVKNTTIVLRRESWENLPKQTWPSGLTCSN